MKTAACLTAALALSAIQAEARPAECRATDDAEIAGLFDRWNAALATLDPEKVVARYADGSILLPTVSDTPRLTPDARRDYFRMFLTKKPQGRIDTRLIKIGCDTAFDAGVYTFTFGDGSEVQARYTFTYAWSGSDWLITSHHSSAMPEQTARNGK